MRKNRCYAEIYNDMDGEVVNLFKVLRDQGEQLKEKLELTPFARNEFEESYLQTECEVERARRTVARSFMGFGSPAAMGGKTGFRGSSNRSGSTPAHDWANYPKHVPKLTSRLVGVVIENMPALYVIAKYDGPDTLHYVDPPYVHSTRGHGNKYCTKHEYRFEMTDADHRELSAALHAVQGMVVISGYQCELYEELYADWQRVECKSFADGARERKECLWLSPNCELGQRTLGGILEAAS